MIRNHRIAAAVSVALALGVVTFSMWNRHAAQSANPSSVRADVAAPQLDDEEITKVLRSNNLGVSDLSVRSIGGIVILRGNGDRESKARAGAIVKSLGIARVANLIAAPEFDDVALARDAERELASTSSLDGCILKVHCERGVLIVTGTVQHELQKDAARDALKAIRGAREVRVDLSL